MNNKYNLKLFLIGFLTNLVRKIPILLIALVLAIIGINNQTCKKISLVIVIFVLLWSLIQQIQIKYIVEHNDDPNFEPFANAMMSDNWAEEIKDIVEEKIKEQEDNNTEDNNTEDNNQEE